MALSTLNPFGAHIPTPPGVDDDRFSRQFKNWREWHNVVDFISNLKIDFYETEILALSADPPDVIFRNARFEVKEIMDEGRKRHDEVKAAHAEAKKNGGRFRTVEYTPKDLTPTQIGDLVIKELDAFDKRQKYPIEQRRDTDLLFYVNKLEHWFENGDMPNSHIFEKYGWRSVSAVFSSQQSMVFQASDTAPEFLIESQGLVKDRWGK